MTIVESAVSVENVKFLHFMGHINIPKILLFLIFIFNKLICVKKVWCYEISTNKAYILIIFKCIFCIMLLPRGCDRLSNKLKKNTFIFLVTSNYRTSRCLKYGDCLFLHLPSKPLVIKNFAQFIIKYNSDLII